MRTRTTTLAAIAVLAVWCLACEAGRPGTGLASADAGELFSDDFESGNLSAWSDGGDNPRLRVVTDSAGSQSGRRYLAVTYPKGEDGGWLTRFLLPGHDSLYVSYYVRFPRAWIGGTKLVAFNGSRRDDRWSAFGKAGRCPDGSDFFSTMLVVEPAGGLRFYTYYPGMAREPDGTTCWGRYGDGTETYRAPLTLGPDEWHRIEFFVTLNTPGEANARQTFWVDGIERGAWSGFTVRESAILQLNSLQLSFSVSGGVPATQELHIDNVVVRSERPARSARLGRAYRMLT